MMLGPGTNLITTIIGFSMSVTLILFACTKLICERLRRRESRQLFDIEPRFVLELPEHGVSGLDPVVVAAIPTLNFHREAFSSSEDTQCAVCLAEYQENEVLRIMPKCGHSFHLSCIDIWLRKQSTCPVCRLSIQNYFITENRHPTTFDPDQTFDSSETTTGRSQANESNNGHIESVTIEVQSSVSVARTASS